MSVQKRRLRIEFLFGCIRLAVILAIIVILLQSYGKPSYAQEPSCKSAIAGFHVCQPFSFAFIDAEDSFHTFSKERLVHYSLCGPEFDVRKFVSFIEITKIYWIKRVKIVECMQDSAGLFISSDASELTSKKATEAQPLHSDEMCQVTFRYHRGSADRSLYAHYDPDNALQARLCQFRAFSIFVGLKNMVDVLHPIPSNITDEELKIAPGQIQSALLPFYASYKEHRGEMTPFPKLIERMPLELACQIEKYLPEVCNDAY